MLNLNTRDFYFVLLGWMYFQRKNHTCNIVSYFDIIHFFSNFRYFDCKPQYGLFAPVHKVTRLMGGMPSPNTRSLANTSLRLSRERSGSQESVSSISSTASSVSRSRVRLGVTSLNSQVHAALLMLLSHLDKIFRFLHL